MGVQWVAQPHLAKARMNNAMLTINSQRTPLAAITTLTTRVAAITSQARITEKKLMPGDVSQVSLGIKPSSRHAGGGAILDPIQMRTGAEKQRLAGHRG